MNYRKAIAAIVALLSVGVSLKLIERSNQTPPNSAALHIYIPCSTLTKASELTVLVDGRVVAEKILRYGGPQPCIDEITVTQPAGTHQILARSMLGNSAAKAVSLTPGENWIVLSPQRARGGSWEWVIEQYTARPKFS